MAECGGFSYQKSSTCDPATFMVSTLLLHPLMWWYSVVVSISGCDPLDPASNPGTARTSFLLAWSVGRSAARCWVTSVDSCACTHTNTHTHTHTHKHTHKHTYTNTHAHTHTYTYTHTHTHTHTHIHIHIHTHTGARAGLHPHLLTASWRWYIC